MCDLTRSISECDPQIENMAYPVTVDAIHTVFSPYGFVQKIAIFEKNNGWQVRAWFT